MQLESDVMDGRSICDKLGFCSSGRMRGHRVLAHPVRIMMKLRSWGNLSFEAAVEEPYRRVAGVVLLRSAAEEEGQLRIPEVAAEAPLGLPVAEAHQQ